MEDDLKKNENDLQKKVPFPPHLCCPPQGRAVPFRTKGQICALWQSVQSSGGTVMTFPCQQSKV